MKIFFLLTIKKKLKKKIAINFDFGKDVRLIIKN